MIFAISWYTFSRYIDTNVAVALGNKIIYISCYGESANDIHVQTSFAEVPGPMDGIQYLLGISKT